jgi:hypothetical protein
MKSLQPVLQKYAGTSEATGVRLGSDETQLESRGEGSSDQQSIDRVALRNDLEAVKRDNNRYFALCVVMVVGLFIACVVLVLTNLKNAGLIKIAMSGFGVSAAGLITMMTNLWRVKSNTEILLVLAINTDSETLRTIVNILAKGL